jgi:hypothetical protein
MRTELDLVRFNYRDKLTKENQSLSFTVNEFIGALVRHVPENGLYLLLFENDNSLAKEKFTL